MNLEEFRELIHEDIELAKNANSSSDKEEFLLYSAGLLESGEEFEDFVECHYDGVTHRKGNMSIDGYAKDDTDGSWSFFIVIYHGPEGLDSIKSDEINSAFKKIRFFVEEATKHEIYRTIDDNPLAKEIARDLFYDSSLVTKFRFYLLTDTYNRQRAKVVKDETIDNKIVELNIWDIGRIFDLVSSKTQKESVDITLEDFGYGGIPCVKAVDFQDIVADIEIPTSLDENSTPENEVSNIVSYSSYLAVVPGLLLNDLYLTYGSKLLEGNVRSFLSARGKVNKSIQNTLKNYPGMFFAYNNGIAATATEIETEMTDSGLVITRIKDLQIVNGGQTTASIANTLLTAKKNESIDLSSVYVPMKISILNHGVAERIIPKISEYSNSQNKVDASDFFSNHPFHIRMEGYSRKMAIPSSGGNQFQQYWFYERTRGQYNQGKMRLTTKTQLKKYTDRYPENMVINMLDLARYMELYECAPDVVSKGKQKILEVFAGNIKTQWQKSNVEFNEYYFRRVVALAIVYKRTDEIVKATAWYKEKRSYKANVVAYAIAVLFNYIKKNKKGYDLDFQRIWNLQDIYEELKEQLEVLVNEVYGFITGPRDTENVTEWCKKELCWNRAKTHSWTINDPFLYSLVETEENIKEGAETRTIENEVDTINEIMAKGRDYWKKVLSWGMGHRLISEKESSILRLVINMFTTGRVPSDKQLKVLMDTKKRLINSGMPINFT